MLSLRGMAGVGYPPRVGQSEARSEMMRPARLAFYSPESKFLRAPARGKRKRPPT
jgi:hypothetical protein